jgi:LAO/AO transport system kinase
MTTSQEILNGNRLALAKLLTKIENNALEGQQALIELFAHTGKAHLIGVTGSPGTGKSSLVNQLALHYRKIENKKIAILAVDPSSPFTGGAVLGDRVRMRDLSGDPNVFIRSMATRGSLGGLAQSTANMTQAFDAAGFDIIIIETVGAGQSEVDIAKLAHTTLVVEAPGLGDDIQAIKAGILEIADILVINKSDRPGVEHTEKALKSMLELAHPTERIFQHHNVAIQVNAPKHTTNKKLWIPPIQRTISTEGVGISDLADAIAKHITHLKLGEGWFARERIRLQVEIEALIQVKLMNQFREKLSEETYQNMLNQVVERNISPWQAVETLMKGNLQ